MSPTPRLVRERRHHDPAQQERVRKGLGRPLPPGVLRSLGLGLITGAADDDPSAIGTYASAGARFGPGMLWTAPVTLPMMFAVVYLSSKLGQVCGEGLFATVRRHYGRWMLYPLLAGALIGNVVEAGADLGGMAAALNVLIPVRIGLIVVVIGLGILTLQLLGTYTLIRDVFRWLALALLAYLGAAMFARPHLGPILRDSLVPHIRLDRNGLTILVAIIGTSLSAYLYSWQSNEDVEEDIAMGRRRLEDRKGTTRAELRRSRRDIWFGMFFSNVVMYFIILSTAATLFPAGQTHIDTAAEAAKSLQPLAGHWAGILFAAGVIGVGFLAVPVMTIGAAYDVAQTFGWRHGLHARPGEARAFYAVITLLTLIATGLNFFGINPMHALVWAGVVQGFSTPFLMLLVMRLTNDAKVVGPWVNSRAMNVLGWITTAFIFAATLGLVAAWL